MFGMGVALKWYVTFETQDVTYYLVSLNDTFRHLVWSQQQAKALKFETSSDAEKVIVQIRNNHKNKKLVFKVK